MQFGHGGWSARRTVYFALALALGALSACTTVVQRQTAVDRVNAVWAADNQSVRSTLAARTLAASIDQALDASERALRKIGLDEISVDRKTATVSGRRQYANAAWSWSDAVRQAEEPRLRQIFVDAIGPQGYFLGLDPKDEVLSATVKVVAAGRKKEAIVSADFRSDNTAGVTCPGGCVTEIPPSALRAGLYEFWRAFDGELSDIQAKTRATARKPRAPAQQPTASRNRSPNEWVVPPKDWVLPAQH